jgi:ankyrin repeat protein
MSPLPQSPLYSLLLEGNWSDAVALVESDTSLAREWHYGIDNDCSSISSEPYLWKRLALHLVCTVNSPIGLIELLIQVYPKALECVDPHNGTIPLHLACRHGCGLETIRALIMARSASTKAVDANGRLPLHHAIIVSAPYCIIDFLVQHDPVAVLCPDQHGKTPLQYAQHSYPIGSRVIGLLELVWM